MLKIKDESGRDRHRILLAGDVDMASVSALNERIDGLVRDGKHKLEIDLTHVQFIDSRGLASLVSAHRKLRGQGRSLALSGVAPNLMRIFEVTGLARYFAFAWTPARSRG